MNYFVNLIWKLSCMRHWRKYQKAKTDVLQAQQNILFNIIRQNEKTRFGKDHSFSSIDSIDKFFIQVGKLPLCFSCNINTNSAVLEVTKKLIILNKLFKYFEFIYYFVFHNSFWLTRNLIFKNFFNF